MLPVLTPYFCTGLENPRFPNFAEKGSQGTFHLFKHIYIIIYNIILLLNYISAGCTSLIEVKLLNVPTDFGPEFLEWAKKTAKDRQQNRFILHGEDTQSSFDTVMAKDAVEKSSGQWRKDGREKSYALVWFGYGLACLCFAFVG